MIVEGAIIRRANPEDAPALTRIAHAAKRHWGYPERWMVLWTSTLTIGLDFISKNEVYAAWLNGEIVGFAALVEADHKVWLEHLWVSPEQIGTGLGKALFQHAVGVAAASGARAIEIESDPNAEGFYRHMGAQRVGEVVSELEGTKRVLPLMTFAISPRPAHLGKA